MRISMHDSIFINLGSFFSGYFGLERTKFKRTLALVGVVLSYALAAYTMIFVQEAFSGIEAIIASPTVTMDMFSNLFVNCTLTVSALASFSAVGTFLSSWLGDELYHHLCKKMINKWIEDKSYNGIKFIRSQDKKINPAVVLGNDLKEICTQTMDLVGKAFNVIMDFIVGAYQLYFLSYPLSITLFNATYALPGYMFLAALVYSLGYGYIIKKIDSNSKSLDEAIKRHQDKLSGHLHHVDENSESIALKQGGKAEQTEILKVLDSVQKIEQKQKWMTAGISFFETMRQQLTWLLGMILSAPNAINGKMGMSGAFSVASYFNMVVNLFCWKKTNTEQISRIDVSLNRYKAFEKLMQEWDAIQKEDTSKINQKSNEFQLNNITAKNPNGDVIFNNLNLKLPAGKRILIQGKSGVGKTTLFRCLARIWPYVTGEIILPKVGEYEELKVYFIPQKAYFPYQGSLLEAIHYPDPVNDKKLNEIKRLMRAFGFNCETIKNLNIEEEWSKTLSGGEQQRIALISAIIKKPDVLFMDESTNGLDARTKSICEKAIKKYLKNTTIVAIDHQASEPMPMQQNKAFSPFYDSSLTLVKNTKKPKEGARAELRTFAVR